MLYSAPHIITLHKGVLEDGTIRVSDNRIADLGRRSLMLKKYPSERETRLDRCVLMPGLVNAHAHLEEGPMRGTVVTHGTHGEWLSEVRSRRSALSEESCLSGVHLGALESLNAGVTTVLDTSATGASFRVLFSEKIRSCVYLEFEGDEGDFDRRLSRAEGFAGSELSSWGVAAASPALATEPLWRRLTAYRTEQELPFAFHLDCGQGEAEPLFKHKLIPAYSVAAHTCTLRDTDIARMAALNLSVAVCPRHYLRFKAGALPVARLLKKGVNVCLGTETLASSDSLDLFEDLYCLKRLMPSLKSADILSLCILGGARALGHAGMLGQIRSGYLADIIGVELAHAPGADLCDELLLEDHSVRFVMVDGREVLS